MSWGEVIQIASSQWGLAPAVGKKKAVKRNRSKSKAGSDSEDASESDCGGESDGEEAAARA